MQTENRFFDDLAKLINGAAGTLAGMTREAEAATRERAKEWIGGLDFVSRDEFEAVKEMAAKAREEADALKARLDALETKAARKSPGKKGLRPAFPVAQIIGRLNLSTACPQLHAQMTRLVCALDAGTATVPPCRKKVDDGRR